MIWLLKKNFSTLIVKFFEIFKVGEIRKCDEGIDYFENKTLSSF